MFDTESIKQDFGHAAGGYDASAHLQKRVRAHCLEMARNIYPSGVTILDAGSGTGTLAQEAPQWHIVALDLAFGMCAEAKKQVSTVNADAASMPFADASFGGIFSSLMLQWSNDVRATLREMLRVLKPEGRVLLSTLTQGTLKELQESFAAVDDAPHVSAFLGAPEVAAYAVHMGFRILSIEETTITEYYPDATSLMQSLKAIGAGNKQADRRKGLTPPGYMEKMQSAYAKRFGSKKGLPATWKILYLMMEKP